VASKSEHLHLNDSQKSRLLNSALAADERTIPSDENEHRGDLLCDLLRRPLPAPGTVCHGDSLPTRICSGELRSVFGPPVRELLLDPRIDLATLKQIKDMAKKQGEQSASAAEKDAFLVVYFSAIARALILHGERITRHTTQDLTRFFNSYAKCTWVASELSTIFGQAHDMMT
jgi:hypothetical protein